MQCTSAIFLFNEIICKHVMIEQILTDQGVSFEAYLFKHLCRLLGSNKIRSSTYHAQANGGIERVNKVIKPALAKYVNDNEDDWDVYLQMTISVHNNTFHTSIGMAPYEAVWAASCTIMRRYYGKPITRLNKSVRCQRIRCQIVGESTLFTRKATNHQGRGPSETTIQCVL